MTDSCREPLPAGERPTERTGSYIVRSSEPVARSSEKDTRLRELEATIEQGVHTFVDVGLALLEIRDTRLYRASHATFDAYCRERWGWQRAHAYRLIDGAKVARLMSPIGDTPETESQARELVPLARQDEREAVEVWRELRERHGDKVTAELVKEAVSTRLSSRAHVSYNSGENEWTYPRVLHYTCGHYTGAATGIRLTYSMAHEWGGIKHLDCGCPTCQPPVKRLPHEPDDLKAFSEAP